ncbi:hypothetical protein ABKP09_16620 [Peribacillus frigoritolerans]
MKVNYMLHDKGWSGTRYDRFIILKKRIGKQSASTIDVKVTNIMIRRRM